VRNYGIMNGLYANGSTLLREVSLCTAGGFLLVIYCMLQFLMPIASLSMRIGLAFWMGGIFGNVSERMISGFSTDFITIGSLQHMSPIFNPADLFQWVGVFLVFFSLAKNFKTLWQSNELRSRYFVNLKFQLSYCAKLVGCGLGFATVIGFFTFSYFKIVLEQSHLPDPTEANQILFCYLSIFTVVSIAFLFLLFIVGMILSHRIAGPIHAFERYISEIEEGKSHSLKFRKKDEFKHLEILAARLKTMIGK